MWAPCKAISLYYPQPYKSQIVGKRGEERKVWDGQQERRVEIRPAQWFIRSGQDIGCEDPDVGLPVTFKSGTGDGLQQQHVEGVRQG